MGRYLSTLAPPLDPLVGVDDYAAIRRTHCRRPSMAVASVPSVSGYAFQQPEHRHDAALERTAATSIASHVPIDQPHIAFVSTTVQAAMATLDRVADGGQYKPSVAYPTNGFGQALQAIAGAMAKARHEGVLRADRRVRHPRLARTPTRTTGRT